MPSFNFFRNSSKILPYYFNGTFFNKDKRSIAYKMLDFAHSRGNYYNEKYELI